MPIIAAKVLALAETRLTALCEVDEPEEAAMPQPELSICGFSMREIKTAPRQDERRMTEDRRLIQKIEWLTSHIEYKTYLV